MYRKRSLALIVSIILLISVPMSVLANQEDMKIIGENENFTIMMSGNEYMFIDYTNDTVTRAVINSDRNMMEIYLPNGDVKRAIRDSMGDIYIDGELVIDCEIKGSMSSSSQISTFSVPSGYRRLVTYRTKQSTQLNIATIAMSLIGLCPGFSSIMTIASVVVGLASMCNDIYIELNQYYRANPYMIYEVTYLYKNPDYTGLIDVVEKGPYRASYN